MLIQITLCALAQVAAASSPPPTLPLRWSTLDPMPLAVFEAGAGVSDEWLVISGGFDAQLDSTPAIQVRHESRGWRPIGTQLAEPRARHTQTTLPDGRILVVGGVQGSLRPDAPMPPTALASAEVFHPLMAGSEFISLGEPLTGHTAHLLPDGRVAVVGASWVRLFDPQVGAFTEAIRLQRPRRHHCSVLWTRTVYPDPPPSLAAGSEEREFEIVEQELSIDQFPTARGASIGATMEPQKVAVPREHHEPTYPSRLVVLIIGGEGEGTVEEVDLADSVSHLWSAQLPSALAHGCAAVNADGRILLIGGESCETGESLAASWWLDSHETISPGPELQLTGGVAAASCFVDAIDGSIVIFGGESRRTDAISSVATGRMIRRGGARLFALPLPREAAPFSRRQWIRLDERRVAAVGGYRFVDAAAARDEQVAPGVHLRGVIDVVRLPSPIGGD